MSPIWGVLEGEFLEGLGDEFLQFLPTTSLLHVHQQWNLAWIPRLWFEFSVCVRERLCQCPYRSLWWPMVPSTSLGQLVFQHKGVASRSRQRLPRMRWKMRLRSRVLPKRKRLRRARGGLPGGLPRVLPRVRLERRESPRVSRMGSNPKVCTRPFSRRMRLLVTTCILQGNFQAMQTWALCIWHWALPRATSLAVTWHHTYSQSWQKDRLVLYTRSSCARSW